MLKAIVIEPNAFHHELIPSWVWALHTRGYVVDVCANRQQPHRDIIPYMNKMKMPFQLVGTNAARDKNAARDTNVARDMNAAQDMYDVVVNNTVYTSDDIVYGKKTYVVLHDSNAASVIPSKYANTTTILSLGPHMHTMCKRDIIPSIFAPPVYFGDDVCKMIDLNGGGGGGGAATFAIQGCVESFRRNYSCLDDLCNRFGGTDGLPKFTMNVIGQTTGTGTGVTSAIKVVANPSFEVLFSFLQEKVHWMMPCVDETYDHKYFTNKITSSVMMAIGNGVPLLLHQQLADVYGLQNDVNCICYASIAELPNAFLKALTLNNETYRNIRRSAQTFRRSWLQLL